MKGSERKSEMNRVKDLLGRIWNYLREVSGENEYARYCRRVERLGGSPLTARTFYLEQLERKNSRPTRCC